MQNIFSKDRSRRTFNKKAWRCTHPVISGVWALHFIRRIYIYIYIYIFFFFFLVQLTPKSAYRSDVSLIIVGRHCGPPRKINRLQSKLRPRAIVIITWNIQSPDCNPHYLQLCLTRLCYARHFLSHWMQLLHISFDWPKLVSFFSIRFEMIWIFVVFDMVKRSVLIFFVW